jgi:hypothetical protein
MSKAETWLGERMTVRRWLATVGLIGVVAVCTAYGAVVMFRSDDGDGSAASGGGEGSAEQRPTAMCITSNVGSFGVLDGRAAVTLDVYPTRLPMEWAVTIRTLAGSGTAPAREIDLAGPEVRAFTAALDDALRHHDTDNDLTVAGTTIHVSESATGEFRYELKCVGTLQLDADAMSDLKRMLVKAEAQRAWLLPRTLALRATAAPVLPAAVEALPRPVDSARSAR